MRDEYEVLADAAERGELNPVPGAARRGAVARARAGEDLRWATGATTTGEAVRMALGRPPVGQERHGASPQWRVRAPQELHARVQALAEDRGVTVSELVRYAVGDYLARQNA